MTTTRVEKTYRGKGPSRRTVWAVRLIHNIGGIEVPETLGAYADEATARTVHPEAK